MDWDDVGSLLPSSGFLFLPSVDLVLVDARAGAFFGGLEVPRLFDVGPLLQPPFSPSLLIAAHAPTLTGCTLSRPRLSRGIDFSSARSFGVRYPKLGVSPSASRPSWTTFSIVAELAIERSTDKGTKFFKRAQNVSSTIHQVGSASGDLELDLGS